MQPEVLLRVPANRLLYEGIYLRCIGNFITTGEAFQWWQVLQGVGAVVRVAVEHQRHDRCPGHAGDLRRHLDTGGFDAEKRGKDADIAPKVLIRRIPHTMSGLDPPHHATQVVTVNCLVKDTAAGAGHEALEERVIMGSIDGIRSKKQRIQRTPQVQGREMHTHNQCSLAFRLDPGHVLLALEGHPVTQMLRITTPAGSGLHEADTIGDKGLLDPLLMLHFIKLWKTESQVDLGDMAPSFGEAPGGQANTLADPEFESPG